MSTVVIFYAAQERELLEQVTSELGRSGVTDRNVNFDMGRTETDATDAAILQTAASADCVVLLWSRSLAASPRAPLAIHAAIQSWSRDRFVLGKPDDEPLPPGLRDLAAQPLKASQALESISHHARDEDVRFLVRLVAERIGASEQIVPGMDYNLDLRRRAPAASAAPSPPSPMPPPMASRAPDRGSPAGLSRGGLIAGALLIVLVGGLFFLWQTRLPSPPVGIPPSDTPGTDWGVLESAAVPIGLLALLAVALIWLVALVRSRRAPTKTAPVAATASRPPSNAAVSPSSSSQQVFISYSRRDAAQVNALASRIETAGFKVWIDTQASDAVPRYAGRIVGAIRSSNVVALMCSRDAFASDHVIREVYVAGDFKKPFVAVQLDEAEFPDDLIYFLSGFPRIAVADFAPERMRQEMARFVAV